MRILVIDDNPDDRQLEMREVFALFPDAEVVELTNFPDFEAALEAAKPDLVLTDLDLRWANGREVLEAVKARYPLCPVVMFTGTGNETIAVELMKAGLDDYVVKSPRQLPRLRTSIKLAIEHANSRAALTDREMQLTRALAQQQTIVRELHHRVKNNLQTISSLLHLRGRTVDSTTRGHLDEIAGRIEALGAVQSRIYDTAEYDRVDFQAVLNDIATSLIKVRSSGKVTLAMRFDLALELDVFKAMPLSLVCYEIVLNAMKHAWPDDTPGTLTVEIVDHDDKPEVRIFDDGIGFAEQETTGGLGTRIIHSLVREAGVVLSVSSAQGSGTLVSMRFL
ncbi:sensor histidine kinase [uncultured Sphingomonas sp.]|uniref:sensor histidine kinase n=1 Tax=uncultured Sphingomonas sp. TaxID=158754 RepID=UPI0035CBC5BA